MKDIYVKLNECGELLGGGDFAGYVCIYDLAHQNACLDLSSIIHIENNRVFYVYCPVNCDIELYYVYQSDGCVIVSSSFEKIVSDIGEFEFNDEKQRFMRKGDCSAGSTYLRGLMRLKPGASLTISEKILSQYQNNKPKSARGKSIYEEFKSRLDNVIVSKSTEKNALLLSGGVDSGLIALILKKNGIKFKAFTSRAQPYHDVSENDFKRSTDFCLNFGVDHQVCHINYDSLSINDLDEVINEMPLASHLSFPFMGLFGPIKDQHIKTVFCGQNLDNLYQFGFTTKPSISRRGLLDLAGRYLTSPMYTDNFQKGWAFQSISTRLIGGLLAWLYSKVKKQKYIQPSNVVEYLSSIESSTDGLPFVMANQKNTPVVSECIDLTKGLVNQKVTGYTRSGASAVLHALSRIYGVTAVLPYSAPEFIDIYYSLDRGWLDIVYPKRFVRRYYAELAKKLRTKKSTSRVVGYVEKKPVVSYHDWCEYIMIHTNLGESIREHIGLSKRQIVLDMRGNTTKAQTLVHYLNEYWIQHTESEYNRRNQLVVKSGSVSSRGRTINV